MIDWLETLWKAAEEGTEVSLPGEAALRPVKTGGASRTEEDQTAAPAEHPERETAPWQYLRRSPADELGVERLYRSAAGSALAALYHRVRETVSPGQPGTLGRGGSVVVREEVPAAPGLTEERLDRSLRRDSRRYDGGMSIY